MKDFMEQLFFLFNTAKVVAQFKNLLYIELQPYN